MYRYNNVSNNGNVESCNCDGYPPLLIFLHAIILSYLYVYVSVHTRGRYTRTFTRTLYYYLDRIMYISVIA